MGIFLITGLTIMVIFLLPVRLGLSVDNAGGLKVVCKVSYGWGLVSYGYSRHTGSGQAGLKVLGMPISGYRSPEKATPGQGDGKVEHTRGLRWLKRLRPYIGDIVRDLVASVWAREASARLVLGFDDPAYTGMAAGLMSYVVGRFGQRVRYTPDFSGENFEIDLRFVGTIIPIVIIYIGIKYCAVYLWDQAMKARNVKGGREYGFNG